MSLEALYQHDTAPAVQQLLCTSALDRAMELLSTIGEGWSLALLVAVLAWRRYEDRRIALASGLRGLAALAAAGAAAQVLKRLVDSPRPLQLLGPERVRVLLEPLRSMSFPSGHSAAAAAFAFWAARHPAGVRRWPLLLAFLVGLSRVYVGAHWVTDVVAGWLLGALTAYAVLRAWPLPRPSGAGTARAGTAEVR